MVKMDLMSIWLFYELSKYVFDINAYSQQQYKYFKYKEMHK